jgi:GMP synthase (glutamine-hydrolysing)
LVGICFGHQIIAQALGGKVEKSDKGWAVGHQTYFYGDTPIGANAWHQDQVVALPEGADVIAGNDFCEYAALSYGGRILTMQPHPEFTDEFVEGMLRERAPGVVPDDLIEKALANKDAVVATKTMIDMITNTFAKATEI